MSGYLVIPDIQQEGFHAMRCGYSMRSSEYPMGFTFCHYKNGSERWNFLVGCCTAVFGISQEAI